MVKKNTKGFTLVELMVVLAIMGILGTMLVTMMNTGGKLYRNTNVAMEAQSDARLAMSYITMRIRQNDVSTINTSGDYVNGITVDMTHSFPVLKIIDSSNGSTPRKFYWIYFVPAASPVPGKLREQYGTAFNTNLESGAVISDIRGFTVSESGTDMKYISIEVESTDGATDLKQDITLRSQ